MRERGLEAVSDSGELEAAVREVLAEHPDQVARYRPGGSKVLDFLMGQVMKASQGKAEPGQVRKALAQRIRG